MLLPCQIKWPWYWATRSSPAAATPGQGSGVDHHFFNGIRTEWSVRSKQTLDWLERMFGKIKQVSHGVNIDRNKTGININERMDLLIPASKIANQNTGEMVGVVPRENQDHYGKYETNTLKCKVNLNLQAINQEKRQYSDLPKFYDFGPEESKDSFLLENLKMIYSDIEQL